MALWASGCGEAEYSGRVNDYGHSVRHNGVVDGVPRRHIAFDHTGDRVRHAMRKMHPGIAKTHASKSRRQQHLTTRFVIP